MIEYNFTNIINIFIEFYEFCLEKRIKNLKSIDDNDINFDFVTNPTKINNEIELTLYSVPFSLFSNLYNFKMNNNSIKVDLMTYFELRIKENKSGNKLRKYINFDNFRVYHITNNKILNSDPSSIWNKKYLIQDKPIKIENKIIGDLKHSLEFDEKIQSSYFLKNKITIYFIRSVSLTLNYLRLNIRLYVKIGPASENKSVLYNYLSNSNNKKIHSCTLEIEYIGDFKTTLSSIKNECEILFKIAYGIKDLNNYYSLFEPKTFNIKGFVKDQELLLSQPLETICLTPKIDGETAYFNYNNKTKKLDLIFNRKHYILSCNLLFDLEGVGEYIIKNNKHYIYPFLIYKLENEKIINRYDLLLKYKEYFINYNITDLEDKYDQTNQTNKNIIYFLYKEFKIFNSYYNMFCYINNVFIKDFNNGVDGLILVNPKQSIKETIIDYKIKLDNTIDLFCILQVLKGVLNGNKIEIKLYVKNNNNSQVLFNELYSTTLTLDSNIFFDVDLNMLIIKEVEEINDNFMVTKIPKNKYHVIPNHFIAEYSFLYNKIMKIRYDKTDNYISYNYFGNSIDVVNTSKRIHDENKIIDIEVLKEICDNPPKIDDDKLINKLFSSETTNQIFYKIKENKRTALNYFSNLSKTDLIAFGLSPLINQRYYNNILSIDGGRGGDISKYFYMNIKSIVVTDIDKNALKEYSNRYQELNKLNRSKMFKFTSIQTSIINDNFIEKVKSVSSVDSFDAIDYQLAIHFYWYQENKKKIINNLQYFSKHNTKLLITTNNGDKIKTLLDIKNTFSLLVDTKNKIYFTITKVNDEMIKIDYLPTQGSNEYLVFSKDIISRFEKNNFILEDVFSFDTNYNYPDVFKLLALKYKRESTKRLFNNLYLNYENEKDNKDLSLLLSLFKAYKFNYI